MLAFEKHQDPSWNVDCFERPNREKNAWKTNRVTFQYGIIAARRGPWAVARLAGVVFCLPPRRQRRKVVAGPLSATSRRQLPHSGEVLSVEARLRGQRNRAARERQSYQHTDRATRKSSHFSGETTTSPASASRLTGAGRENLKLDESCISNSKLEISEWTR
jgi:hypothetical protein